MKYRKDWRAHLFEVTTTPPTMLANAAASAKRMGIISLIAAPYRSGFALSRSRFARAGIRSRSSAVPNRQDIAVLDPIFFSFKSKQSLFFQSLHGSVLDEIFIMANFGTNEMVR